ncbi:MAG: hypothetical protein ABL900_10620, partial [Burkholderiaceae bacterium]
RTRRAQRGTTLLEGLVAFLVLSLGMLSVVRVQTQMRLNTDVARQRSEAVRIAQEDIERLRAFSVIAVRTGATAFASVASATRQVNSDTGQPSNTSYSLTREITAGDTSLSKNARISVAWDDRTGARQQVALSTLIAGHDPAYAGALQLHAKAPPLRAVHARSAWIPLQAKDLGQGHSAFKPIASGTEVLVYDNTSGNVTARCSGVDATLSNANLSAAALGTCEALQAYSLSGVVRFSGATPPEPAAANDVPLELSIAITTSDAATPPVCRSEARKSVRYTLGGATRTEAVPIGALPATLGLGSWVETGERFVAYHCVVVPAVPGGAWSGRAGVAPTGWTLGAGAGDYRVCRFSADVDGSGAIDNNLEHPDSYSALRSSLTQQNFLVIKGTQSCPTAPAGTAGTSPLFADLSTAPHQP